MADDELDCSSVFKEEQGQENLENLNDQEEVEDFLDDEEDEEAVEKKIKNFPLKSSAMSEYMSGNRDLYRFLDVLYTGSVELLKSFKGSFTSSSLSSEDPQNLKTTSAEEEEVNNLAGYSADSKEDTGVNSKVEGEEANPAAIHAHLYDSNFYQIP